VIAKINDNAYKIDLPTAEYGVSNSFNVADLTPYEGEDIAASRSTPFKGGEDDEDIPITPPLSPTPFDDEDVAAKKSNDIRIGPITRACAKLLEQQVNSLLIEPNLLFSENFILPKSMHLCMIRFVDNMSVARGGDESQQEEQDLMSKCAREKMKAGTPGDYQNVKYT
jgi:hypothetical protein